MGSTKKERDVLRSGYLYSPPLPLSTDEWVDRDVYAYCPQRIWWKPWRWRVLAIAHVSFNAAYGTTIKYDEVIATNLSRDGVIGTLKLLNAWRGE